MPMVIVNLKMAFIVWCAFLHLMPLEKGKLALLQSGFLLKLMKQSILKFWISIFVLFHNILNIIGRKPGIGILFPFTRGFWPKKLLKFLLFFWINEFFYSTKFILDFLYKVIILFSKMFFITNYIQIRVKNKISISCIHLSLTGAADSLFSN